MKSLILMYCLMLLSLMASSQQYKLKVTNTRNNHYYYIKPGQRFQCVPKSRDAFFLRYIFDSVSSNGTIYARMPKSYGGDHISFTIDRIHIIKVQPRNVFKFVSKTVVTTVLLVYPVYSMFAYTYNDNVLSVIMSTFAILAPQTGYGILERIWLRYDKRLTRGKNLKIEVVPVHEEKPDQKYDFDR